MSALRLAAVSLDCPDLAALTRFYLDLLGGELVWQTATSTGVRTPAGVLVLHRVVPYVPPAWPGTSVVHLDLDAGGDLEAFVAHALGCGAELADLQPDDRWRVLLDPAGHPFCITTLTPP